MLQHNYFFRIIKECKSVFQYFLEKGTDQQADKDFKELYQQYVSDHSPLRNFSVEEAVDYARQKWEEDRRIQKLEMLAELWHTEAACNMNPTRDLFLNKAFNLYDYIDAHSNEGSLPRKLKKRVIKRKLQQGE